HYMVEPTACSPAAGWEKGQVENQVQTARGRFFAGQVRRAISSGRRGRQRCARGCPRAGRRRCPGSRRGTRRYPCAH
ncbi:MAG: hypothetical protein EOP92_07400, partial [Lysobacteraceae bacterium]